MGIPVVVVEDVVVGMLVVLAVVVVLGAVVLVGDTVLVGTMLVVVVLVVVVTQRTSACWHTPKHASRVHGSPSSEHGCSSSGLASNTQPLCGSHVSTVHSFVSSQTFAEPAIQVPDASHVSPSVHASPSSHGAPSTN